MKRVIKLNQTYLYSVEVPTGAASEFITPAPAPRGSGFDSFCCLLAEIKEVVVLVSCFMWVPTLAIRPIPAATLQRGKRREHR